MQIIALAAAGKFFFHSLNKHAEIIFRNICLHGVAIARCLLDNTHIPNAAERHIKRARNRRGGKGEHINAREFLLQLFFLRNAEALLLIYNKQAEIAEFNILADNAVRADKEINAAVLKPFNNLFLLCGRHKS